MCSSDIFAKGMAVKKQSLFGITSEGLLKPNENQIFSIPKVPWHMYSDNTPVGVYLYPHGGIFTGKLRTKN